MLSISRKGCGLVASCALLSLAFSSSAVAADLYSPSIKDEPVYSSPNVWSGIYFGIHAGYGWDDSEVDLRRTSGALFYSDPFLPEDQFQDFDDLNGFLGGFQIGINRQFGKIVAGLEGDVSWTDIDDTITTGITPFGSAQWDISTELKTLATFRGRLGYLVTNNLMVFGTAGVAWGRLDVKQATTFISPPDVGGRTSGTKDHVGWTIGGGLEYAFSENWTLKGEYLYVDLGKEDYALQGRNKPPGIPSVPYTELFAAEHEFHIVRAGLNYKF